LTFKRELARKALHLTSAAVPLAYGTGAVPFRVALPALCALAAAALAVEAARARSERARGYFTRAAGGLLRAHEHHRLSGATWMLLAFALAVGVFPRDVAAAATWGVGVGDAAAAVVGKWWSARHAARLARRARLARQAGGGEATRQAAAEPAAAGKTLAGSVACAVATCAGALLVARLGVGESALAGAAAAAAERAEHPFDDNLRIVVGVGATLVLWRVARAALHGAFS